MPIVNIAFYKFVKLNEPLVLRDHFEALCRHLKLRGTILLATEGVNGMLAGSSLEVDKFLDALNKQIEFKDILIKKSYSGSVPFQRLLVRVKPEILTLRRPGVDPVEGSAPPMKAEVLHRLLKEKKELALIDVRNQFEIEYGTFENAIDPKTKSFGQFSDFIKDLNWPKDKMIVTFCTGGIRCEKATLMLMNEGYQNVYQLEGGILEYFAKTPGDFFKGHCFVFDEREALDNQLRPVKFEKTKLPQKIRKNKNP